MCTGGDQGKKILRESKTALKKPKKKPLARKGDPARKLIGEHVRKKTKLGKRRKAKENKKDHAVARAGGREKLLR